MFDLPTDTIHRLLNARDASKGLSTDTREDLENQVFFALRGANFDGNAFVKRALDQGAAHAVTTDSKWVGHPKVTVVDDELGALQCLARAYRRRWTCPVLGMTGSNGKTTTKELIRDVLREAMDVHATKGNLNNHIGVPLTLLNAPAQPDFVVIEMGANHQGEIDLLSRIAEPTHGYITNIGLAHLEGFGGEEGVYRGKKELFDHLAAHGGTAFVQEADSKVVRASQGVEKCVAVPTPSWTWTPKPEGGGVAAFHGAAISMELEGSYNLGNVAAAVAIGAHFGVSWEQAQRALSAYVPTNHRSQTVVTDDNWVLLDAYNANPSSMAHAVNDFAKRDHAGALAILGDMAELGNASEEAHRHLAHSVREQGLTLWTVGSWFGEVHRTSQSEDWRHFDSFEALVEWLQKEPLSNTHVLVKGSRSAGLERLLPYL